MDQFIPKFRGVITIRLVSECTLVEVIMIDILGIAGGFSFVRLFLSL